MTYLGNTHYPVKKFLTNLLSTEEINIPSRYTTTKFDDNFTFGYTEAFENDFSRLVKKFRSLPESMLNLCVAISAEPPRFGSRYWYIIQEHTPFLFAKRRLPCRELKKQGLRVVLAFNPTQFEIDLLEIYSKNEFANPDFNRIEAFIDGIIGPPV